MSRVKYSWCSPVILCVLFVFNLLFNFSCTRSSDYANDPKSRLREYIAKSFAVKGSEDKLKLLEFLTGHVKSRFESWSDDQFREAFVDSKREFIRVNFRELKSISANEVQITYELTYNDSSKKLEGQTHSARVTNKKLCQMVMEKNQWMIADVKNIKELIEYQNELSLP